MDYREMRANSVLADINSRLLQICQQLHEADTRLAKGELNDGLEIMASAKVNIRQLSDDSFLLFDHKLRQQMSNHNNGG